MPSKRRPASGQAPSLKDLASAVAAGDRAALARAVTLVESTRRDDRAQAGELVTRLLAKTGKAVRLGITGPPGVGKSTLIDRLGLDLVEKGMKVAVLAVDPSSALSGGSILADKTRMPELSAQPAAYIRPSPTAGTPGGAARRTREALLVCEAAGFDVVIVETVGIGQSEAAVADVVDFVAVLVQPGSGDELQGLKKGVIEIADMIAVTKADGAAGVAATRTAGDYRAALNIVAPAMPGWRAPVIELSAVEHRGVDTFWDTVMRHRAMLEATGALQARRREQAVRGFRRLVEEELVARFTRDAARAAGLAALEERVRAGELTPGLAADQALAHLDSRPRANGPVPP